MANGDRQRGLKGVDIQGRMANGHAHRSLGQLAAARPPQKPMPQKNAGCRPASPRYVARAIIDELLSVAGEAGLQPAQFVDGQPGAAPIGFAQAAVK
jgi:hypothetical protein